jgi:DMSO/TMAO reductase YedYZ heme-binding membrane subunit
VFLAFGSVGSEAFFGWTLPPAVHDYVHQRFSSLPGLADVFPLLVLATTVLCSFAAWIGLVSYWSHARRLYLIASGLGVFHILLAGPSIKPSIAEAITVVNAMVGGAIIGLVYFSELARRFERPADVAAAASFGAHRI